MDTALPLPRGAQAHGHRLEQQRTRGTCSVEAVQRPSSDARKGTQEPGLPGPCNNQGKSLTTCASNLPHRRAPGCGPARPSEVLLSAGRESLCPRPPPEPHPSRGLKGKLRQKGSGRAAQARTAPCSRLQWPLSPSARSKKVGAAWVWLALTTWHCPTTVPSHPAANPCTSRHHESAQDPSTPQTQPGPGASAHREPVPSGQHEDGDHRGGPSQELEEGVGRARAATQDKNRRGQDRHTADRQTDRQGAAVLTIICH